VILGEHRRWESDNVVRALLTFAENKQPSKGSGSHFENAFEIRGLIFPKVGNNFGAPSSHYPADPAGRDDDLFKLNKPNAWRHLWKRERQR
jgi:hypothetical protein